MAKRPRAKPARARRGRVTAASGRYTPPAARQHGASPPWLIVLMVSLFTLGTGMTMTGYWMLAGSAQCGVAAAASW